MELLAVFLPLLGALLSLPVCRCKIAVQAITLTCMAFSAFFAICAIYTSFSSSAGVVVHELMPWLHVCNFSVIWSVRVDNLSLLMTFIVTTVSFFVHWYSLGYMHGDKSVARFFITLSMFTFFMLMLVVSNDFLQMFFGWEGVGLSSYLLIGYWYSKYISASAAFKAFLVNRIGDMFLLVAILGVYWFFGSLDFAQVFAKAPGVYSSEVMLAGGLCVSGAVVLGWICLFLLLGCAGKSAQFGLHVWLPDAMAGPTPVSALIHAATMVTAGVFLIARCSPLFELADWVRHFIIYLGSLTCVFAACVAVMQDDIKRIIAYSTCSQLGYMFVACGLSAYNLAIFHLITHAFFKALLFLCAGNVIHSMKGEQNIKKMGDCLSQLKYTHALMLIGCLALSGVFPFAGFYSKDLIIGSAYNGNCIAFIASVFGAFLTSIYSARLLIFVFYIPASQSTKLTGGNVIESPFRTMLVPLLPLALGALSSGFVLYDLFDIEENDFWSGSISVYNQIADTPFWVEIFPMVMSILGIVLAFFMFYRRPSSLKSKSCLCECKVVSCFSASLSSLCTNSFYVDELYHYIFVLPFRFLSLFFWRFVDVLLIDQLGVIGLSTCAVHLSTAVSRLQNGNMLRYATVMVMGFVFACGFFLYFSF